MGAKIDRESSTTVVLSWLSGAGTSQEVWSLIWCLCEAPATCSLHFLLCKLKPFFVFIFFVLIIQYINILQFWALDKIATQK